MTNFLAIGCLTKPFGLAGGIKAKSFSGESEHFLQFKGKEVQLRMQDHSMIAMVQEVEKKGENIVMYFHGYAHPEEVNKIRGYEIWVPRDLAAPLGKDEFYVADLMGCHVEYQGKTIGHVVGFFEAAQIVLEILLEDDEPFYVPFHAHFIGEVNVQEKRVELLNGREL